MSELGLLARFLRWLSNLLWPGDYDRDYAKAAYKAYLNSSDVEKLKTAIDRFELAIGQYRTAKNSPLLTALVNQSVAIWKRYENDGRDLKDLEKVISLNAEARKSWSNKNTQTYLLVLTTLAGAYFEQYQRAFGTSSIGPDERKKAFDKAVKYYSELKKNPAAIATQRITAQVQLGIMYRTRYELESTDDSIEDGINHLQNALDATDAEMEVDDGDEKQVKKAEFDNTRITCHLNLAESYDIRYERRKDPQDLTKAIDSNKAAKDLLSADRHELPVCMYNLSRQLRLRWVESLQQTPQQSPQQDDYSTARKLADEVKQMNPADARLKEDIDLLLALLNSPSRQATADSEDIQIAGALSRQGTIHGASNNARMPQRRSTLNSLNG